MVTCQLFKALHTHYFLFLATALKARQLLFYCLESNCLLITILKGRRDVFQQSAISCLLMHTLDFLPRWRKYSSPVPRPPTSSYTINVIINIFAKGLACLLAQPVLQVFLFLGRMKTFDNSFRLLLLRSNIISPKGTGFFKKIVF